MSDQAREAYQEMMARDGINRLRERIIELEKSIEAGRKLTSKWLELCQDEQTKHKATFARAEKAESLLVKCGEALREIEGMGCGLAHDDACCITESGIGTIAGEALALIAGGKEK